MNLGDKITFFDEYGQQFKGIVDVIRNPRVNADGKIIRKNLIDVKVSRMQGVFQIYENTPLKQDLEKGEKTFCYQLIKKEKSIVDTKTDKAVKSIPSKKK